MEIKTRGKTWILNYGLHECPDCGLHAMERKDWTVRDVHMGDTIHHILETECPRCGCIWTITRREELQ